MNRHLPAPGRCPGRRRVLLLLALAAAAPGTAPAAVPGPAPAAALAAEPGTAEPPALPVEHFASLPDLSSAALSPGGSRLAFIGHLDGVAYVLIADLPAAGTAPAAAPTPARALRRVLRSSNEVGVIQWLRWASERVLLVSTRGPGLRRGVRTIETRLLAVDVVGGSALPLYRPGRRDGRWVPQIQDRIVDLLPGDPDHVLLALDVAGTGAGTGVYRVNVHNARRYEVEPPRPGHVDWLADAEHRVRVGVEQDGDRYRIHVRPPEGRAWRPLWAFDAFSADAVEPLGFGLDPERLYVAAYHRGFLAVFRVDLSSPDLGRELILADPGRDLTGRLLHSPQTGEAIGLVLAGGRTELWEPAYEPFQRGLKAALPSLQTVLLGMSDDEQRYLAFGFGEREPGTFFLGDRARGTLSPVGYRHERLAPELLSGKRRIVYPARDGTRIEAFLTLPPGRPDLPLPAVVFPHGGPIASDGMAFDYWSEFFASRGYAVLQMNFRGSSGYGIDFLRAGLGQWGGLMQDDVVDGTRWLAAEGLADPNRICIVGGSYGGYAALLGAALTPELYRCVVSFAGVTDLRALLARSRRFQNRELIETQLGDRRNLAARSPVTLAARISAPVLLVHGSDDRVVPVAHGRAMQRALERAGKPHEYVEQAGGDHFLSEQTHRIELFRMMERFLARHLAPAGDGLAAAGGAR